MRELLDRLLRAHWVWLMLIGAATGGAIGTATYHFQDPLRSAWVSLTLTEDEATLIQTQNIADAVKTLYADKPAIPAGDITRIAIQAGAFKEYIPDLPFDSVANERVRQSMARLHVDAAVGQVKDDHGRPVHVVVAEGDRIKIVYGGGD